MSLRMLFERSLPGLRHRRSVSQSAFRAIMNNLRRFDFFSLCLNVAKGFKTVYKKFA